MTTQVDDEKLALLKHHYSQMLRGVMEVIDGLGLYTAMRVIEEGAGDAELFLDGGGNTEADLIDHALDAVRASARGPVVLILGTNGPPESDDPAPGEPS